LTSQNSEQPRCHRRKQRVVTSIDPVQKPSIIWNGQVKKLRLSWYRCAHVGRAYMYCKFMTYHGVHCDPCFPYLFDSFPIVISAYLRIDQLHRFLSLEKVSRVLIRDKCVTGFSSHTDDPCIVFVNNVRILCVIEYWAYCMSIGRCACTVPRLYGHSK
jgi:hypothetical protein